MLKYCMQLGIPIIIVEFSNCGKTNRKILEAVSGYNKAHFVEKTSWSAFSGRTADGTPFDDLLQRLGVGAFILGGVEAVVCLRETAEEGLEKGYYIAVCGDLTAGYGRSKRYSNRKDLWQPIGVAYFEDRGSAYRYLQDENSEDS